MLAAAWTCDDVRRGVFIHIPKTAGSSIEAGNVTMGAWSWRQHLRRRAKLPYPVKKGYSSCPLWHRPPLGRVPGSFCIVRDPADRALSEARYQLEFKARFHRPTCSCAGLRRFLETVTRRASQDWNFDDCHWVPQHVYVKSCERPIPFDHVGRVLACVNASAHLKRTSSCPLFGSSLRRTCPSAWELLPLLPGWSEDAALAAAVGAKKWDGVATPREW